MGLIGSGFTFPNEYDPYDLTFEADTAYPIGVLLLRQRDVAQFGGAHQSYLQSEPVQHTPAAYLWKNGGQGAGYSRRLPEITASSLGGSLTSLGYSYAPWCTSVVPGILMPSGELTTMTTPAQVTSGTIIDGISYKGSYYLTTSGRYLIRIPGETGTPTAIDLGSGFTCVNLAVFKSYLWISGQGSGTIRRYDGTTLTNGGTNTERSRLAVVNWTISPQIATGGAADSGGTNATRMIGTNPSGTSFQHVADTADPTDDDDWSGDITIGDGQSYTTQWICSNNHTVWFATTGGVVACDETGYTPNITEWMKLHYHPSNGGQAVYWNGVVWYAHESGLVVVPVTGERQDMAERWAQFGYGIPNQTPIYGRPRALAPGGDCLWVGYVNTQSGTSYVMRLILERDGTIRWSGPEAVFPNETISLIRRVSPSSGVPYLLIATQTGGGSTAPKIYRQDLPVSGNPYADWLNVTGYRSAASSQVYLPREDLESASRKSAEQYTVVAQNLGEDNQIAAYASVDDGAYTLQMTAIRSGRTNLPAPTSQNSGVTWNWRLDCTGSATRPWVLETFGAGMAVIPNKQTVRSYRVILASRQMLRNNAEEVRDVASLWNRIDQLQQRRHTIVRDQWGRMARARVEQVIEHEAFWDEQRQTWVLVGTVVVRYLENPARFSTGYGFSTGATFAGVS